MKTYIYKLCCIVTAFVTLCSCEAYLEPDLSDNQLATSDVFVSDATALAAINGIYGDFTQRVDPISISNGSLSVIGGLCADELYDFTQEYQAYNINEVPFTAFGPEYYYWFDTYNIIYSANAILEGLEDAPNLSEDLKIQLRGESYFVRAFLHFYLVNMYGGIPIIISTDYKENASKGSASVSEVYEQVVNDLKKAEELLTDEYPSSKKLRPNKYVVQAMLSRVYLYMEEWQLAEEYATKLISGPYALEEDPNNVFTIENEETIWQLMPSNANSTVVNEGRWFNPGQTPTYVLTETVLNALDTEDARFENWVKNVEYENQMYYYPFKYKPSGGTSIAQYSVVLRLGEQYLIRAEARAKQDKLNGALEDLNKVRTVHGDLEGFAGGMNPEELLSKIIEERQIEFLGEWGHRWLDLKRTGKADAVLSVLKPKTWEATDVLWPINTKELGANPKLEQNPGY
ncbi:RagB/SusD family nutrient uptake outer membrane protein [Zunongwangia pacifica]|uniref:RagB/SusD family nutrient uptake outer membrane protein n=1 Tax=Zunongwangia pacifica TaxID=2911062 RepID=A0A9X2A2E8_9FLAO|nr:RagB/SusD family nutrient uptake outer membrane protein [Zunongwangia pacifica]MCL6220901.1 RagB/SusD family nutrient uptake outer membrane protein [Zunongwangia pacifica]